MALEVHFPKRDRPTGVTNIKRASHPRTKFFYGFTMSPKSARSPPPRPAR